MQSFVIVSLKTVLKHVTDLVTANGARTGMSSSIPEPMSDPMPPVSGGASTFDGPNGTVEQIDTTRTQEIANKDVVMRELKSSRGRPRLDVKRLFKSRGKTP